LKWLDFTAINYKKFEISNPLSQLVYSCLNFIVLVIVDVAVYILLGLFLMGNEDKYGETSGELWSWKSLTTTTKTVYILLTTWNILNILLILYFLYRIFLRLKTYMRN